MEETTEDDDNASLDDEQSDWIVRIPCRRVRVLEDTALRTDPGSTSWSG